MRVRINEGTFDCQIKSSHLFQQWYYDSLITSADNDIDNPKKRASCFFMMRLHFCEWNSLTTLPVPVSNQRCSETRFVDSIDFIQWCSAMRFLPFTSPRLNSTAVWRDIVLFRFGWSSLSAVTIYTDRIVKQEFLLGATLFGLIVTAAALQQISRQFSSRFIANLNRLQAEHFRQYCFVTACK